MVLERIAQRCCGAGTGFAVTLGYLQLQLREHILHCLRGVGPDFGVNLGLLRLAHRLGWDAAGSTQLVSPHRHRW